jgi:predicted AlkP superfamily pyrophosphatase or phosphodiesterase
MRYKHIGALVLLTLHAGVLAAPVPDGGGQPNVPDRDRYVAIISLDGFAAHMFAEPTLAIPTLRRLARDGAVAKSMEPVNPTVTWPNHTSLVTGVAPLEHSVLYNGWAVRGGEGEPITVQARVPKTELVRGLTLYDAAHQAGLTTAEVDWVAVERASTITWSFAEWASGADAVPREMIATGSVTSAEMDDFLKAPITFKDEIWTRAGEHIVTTHKPNLLLLHLLTTDSVQHTYGPDTLAARAALSLADAKVGRLVDAYRRAGILDRTTFFVVSDHGFRQYRKTIRPNALLKQRGLSGLAWVVPEGGTAMVYVTRRVDKAATLATLRALFASAEGITQVLTPADFERYGYPQPSANPRMADLVLATGEGFAFHGAPDGDPVVEVPAGASPGGHGFLGTDPKMQAIFVASGAAVKSGVRLDVVKNLDVAPTAARVLGVRLPAARGRVLTEILR